VNIVQSLRQPCLVVITGGEPFRQDISPLVRLLINTGYRVQVETNGTYSQDRFPWAKTIVICSPKTAKLHPGLQINYFKYVLDAEHIDPKDGLPTSVLGSNIRPARPNDMDAVPIYISPADEYNEEKNEKNLRACIQSVFNFGYILSCQSHKEWQLP
jgi:organic radical activating enzyme